MMGISPSDFAGIEQSLTPRLAACGSNCGTGASEMVACIHNLAQAVGPDVVLVAKGNCGIPQYVDGSIVYNGTPELMSVYAKMALDAGARIIGGCCGTSAKHLRAMKDALDAHTKGPSPTLDQVVSALGDVSAGARAQWGGELSRAGWRSSGGQPQARQRTARRRSLQRNVTAVQSAAPSYLVGVDTGGTYTDAAIIETQRHRVVATAKAITTKGDLAVGVGEAIGAALAQLQGTVAPPQIAMVSVSTTLATNAVVEGHGSAVGVVLVGFDAAMVQRTGIAKAFPELPLAVVGGGHNHNGDALCALDLQALEQALDGMAPAVDAFAVASTFAVRNPAHEHAVRDAIVARTGKPVTLSTELSSSLDAPRRALTAVLNARLIARISSLIEAVQRAMGVLQIQCPLMIVKGDGSLALAESVATRPIETVLQWPRRQPGGRAVA